MTLQEAEIKLSDIDSKMKELLAEREVVLKEWNAAFRTQNPENIECIDEMAGDCHILYLVNGESKMEICRLSGWELKQSVEDFYRIADNMIKMTNIANGREYELPENQNRLVHAKLAEIRENWEQEMGA